ncbi:cell division site-positioning protein MapZ family protein [Streptococcus sp. CSL10205-OR2]|uniref:cell division site-positioning protein MapZ family protein n=1 Tax=Streptococcus sp. CSL10205-OR2 TaxID=2980558 RepID=UPI0021DB51E4|nr:cell division site-positioning protein MapZ family protein [Streptococcus sp. CSL10205-OR2]MCU9532950.1 cell division site-positioning protein MapZ family protein [Streptococcus sp. CSL10205-OR2]
MTVEEAIRKDSEIKAGIDENDNILDKYIKQHRDEVGKHKFESKIQASQDDLKEIDDFIQEKREEINQEEETNFSQETIAFDHIEPEEFEESDDIIFDETKKSSSKKGLIIGSLIALLIAVFAFGYVLNNLNSPSTDDKEPTVAKETDTSKAKEEDIKAFDDLYAGFFVDKEMTKPKNSEFERLSELEKVLNNLKGTSTYADKKEKYDSLKKAIDAIKVVNDQFTEPAIVDGEKISRNIKDSANFDAISTTMLNTGKANLDNVLQSAVSEGRQQLTQKAEKEKVASANQAASEAPAPQPSNGSANSVPPAPAAPATNNAIVTNNAASLYGITNYDPASLQRDLSRVPYNNDVIADVNNPSWVFNDGILERIVAVAQERGLISGNNYILERVNIINGNGYYNMFKPDGTYLFSINAKTGYFVGNAPGRADDLDY